MSLSPLHSV